MNEQPVKIDQYENRVVVFVCGYAINENESDIHAARSIAIQLGQKVIPVYDHVIGNPHKWEWNIDTTFAPTSRVNVVIHGDAIIIEDLHSLSTKPFFVNDGNIQRRVRDYLETNGLNISSSQAKTFPWLADFVR
jgi:hypothetical protein